MRSEGILCKKNLCQKMYRNRTESFPQAFLSSEKIKIPISQDGEVYGLTPRSCLMC